MMSNRNKPPSILNEIIRKGIRYVFASSVYYSEKPISFQIYSAYRRSLEIIDRNGNSHVDHKRKIIFIHNPKVAGTTLRKVLKLPKNGFTSHFTPTFLVSPKIWKEYFSIVAVRHPIERLISSYYEETRKDHLGFYHRIYPNIHDLNLREYFELFKKEPFITTPQHRYTRHQLSVKPVDFVIRFENLKEDLKLLSKKVNFKINHKSIPHLNKRAYYKNKLLRDKKLIKEIQEYYRHDYAIFGYKYKY